MTECEKMLAGQLYSPADPALEQARLNAKMHCFQFNQLAPTEHATAQSIFCKLFGKADRLHIEPPFYCDYGFNIEIGQDFFANHHCTILDCAQVRIGDNVLFGPNVSLFTAAHPLDPDERRTGLEYAEPITIGNNVWIGGNTVVLPNVTIGDNAVIGAGSVVTKDIPANHIAVGNPCRVLRPISEQDRRCPPANV